MLSQLEQMRIVSSFVISFLSWYFLFGKVGLHGWYFSSVLTYDLQGGSFKSLSNTVVLRDETSGLLSRSLTSISNFLT